MSRRPRLICLNLQRDRLSADSATAPWILAALANAQACIGWARRAELPVIHILSTSPSMPERDVTPLPGFEARSEEVLLFKNATSIFESDACERAFAGAPGAFVVGLGGDGDCIVSAVDAGRKQTRLAFVVDAIASPRLAHHDAGIAEAIIAELLCGLSAATTTAELLARELEGPAPLRGLLATRNNHNV